MCAVVTVSQGVEEVVFSQGPRIAMVSVHTSPLDQPGIGEAGGMNVYIAELSRALARRGAQVEIFTRVTSSALPETVPLDHGDNRVLVQHVQAGPYEGLNKNDLPGQLCAMTAGVLRMGAARPPGWFDVVHSHYWLSGQVGWLAAERWDVPLVHTMHTLARVKNASLAPGDTAEPPTRVIGEEQVVAAADALVANTDEEAQELIGLYDADPTRVQVVAPGVDLGTFAPPSPARRAAIRTELGLPADRQVVVFAGRVQPLKAPDVLINALGVLRATGRPVPLLVVLGGPSGRPQALHELRALAEEQQVGDDVWFQPPETRAGLARWLAAADLVAMPSRSESFGLVAVEAQACGTPVLASAVGGLRSVVSDGVSGRLVSGHDPVRWADSLEETLADHRLGSQWRIAAARVASRYDWDVTAERLLWVYSRAGRQRVMPAIAR